MGSLGAQIRFQRFQNEPTFCGIIEPQHSESPFHDFTNALRENIDKFSTFPSQPVTSFPHGVLGVGHDSAMITRTVDGKPFAELTVDMDEAELLFHFNHTYEDCITGSNRTIVGSLVYTLTPNGMIVPARIEVGGSNSTGTVLLPEEWCAGIPCLNWQSNTHERSREQVIALLTSMFLSEEDDSSPTVWSKEWRSEIYTWVHENRDLLQESMRTRYSHMQQTVNSVIQNFLHALMSSSHQFRIENICELENEGQYDVYHPNGRRSSAYSFTFSKQRGVTTYLFNDGISYITLDENEQRLHAGVRTREGGELWSLTADSSTVHLQMNFPESVGGAGTKGVILQIQLLRNGRLIPKLQLASGRNLEIPHELLEILDCISATGLTPEEVLTELIVGFFTHGEEVDLRSLPYISPHNLYTDIWDRLLDNTERIATC